MVNHPWKYHLDISSHSSYMIPQTNTCYHKIISVGIVFPSNSKLFSCHTHVWAWILYFKLSIMFGSPLSQPCACIFKPNLCYYLSYVSYTSWRIYKLKLLHKLTTQITSHSRVKLSITQNMGCCCTQIVESQSKWNVLILYKFSVICFKYLFQLLAIYWILVFTQLH